MQDRTVSNVGISQSTVGLEDIWREVGKQALKIGTVGSLYLNSYSASQEKKKGPSRPDERTEPFRLASPAVSSLSHDAPYQFKYSEQIISGNRNNFPIKITELYVYFLR